jgi:hypothetical protein
LPPTRLPRRTSSRVALGATGPVPTMASCMKRVAVKHHGNIRKLSIRYPQEAPLPRRQGGSPISSSASGSVLFESIVESRSNKGATVRC